MNHVCNHYVEIGLGTVDNSDDMQHRKPRRRPNWVEVNVKEKQNGTYKTKQIRNKISVRLWQGDDYMRKCCAKKEKPQGRRPTNKNRKKKKVNLNTECALHSRSREQHVRFVIQSTPRTSLLQATQCLAMSFQKAYVCEESKVNQLAVPCKCVRDCWFRFTEEICSHHGVMSNC